MILSIGFTFLLLFFGIWYFRRTEKTFADII
jgi:ABC-type polysaccharide/polyol phosphate export permease